MTYKDASDWFNSNDIHFIVEEDLLARTLNLKASPFTPHTFTDRQLAEADYLISKDKLRALEWHKTYAKVAPELESVLEREIYRVTAQVKNGKGTLAKLTALEEQFAKDSPKFEVVLTDAGEFYLKQSGGMARPKFYTHAEREYYEALEMGVIWSTIQLAWSPQVAAQYAMGKLPQPGAKMFFQAYRKAVKSQPVEIPIMYSPEAPAPTPAPEVPALTVAEWFAAHGSKYGVRIDAVNNTAALEPSSLDHPPFTGADIYEYTALVADHRAQVADTYLRENTRYLTKELRAQLKTLHKQALSDVKLARKEAKKVRATPPKVPAVMQPVMPVEGPVTWEALAISRYGKSDGLERGQKGAVTREYNRRYGIAPKTQANHKSAEWLARAQFLYGDKPVSEMKPWEKANVTKDLRRNPTV